MSLWIQPNYSWSRRDELIRGFWSQPCFLASMSFLNICPPIRSNGPWLWWNLMLIHLSCPMALIHSILESRINACIIQVLLYFFLRFWLLLFGWRRLKMDQIWIQILLQISKFCVIECLIFSIFPFVSKYLHLAKVWWTPSTRLTQSLIYHPAWKFSPRQRRLSFFQEMGWASTISIFGSWYVTKAICMCCGFFCEATLFDWEYLDLWGFFRCTNTGKEICFCLLWGKYQRVGSGPWRAALFSCHRRWGKLYIFHTGNQLNW